MYKLIIFILLLLPFSAKAIGLSISPSSLDLISPDIKEYSLSIKNISKEPIISHIQVDEYSDNIILNNSEIQLLPEQVTQIKIKTDFSNFEEGIKKTNISVISKALDKKSFNAATGIKVPITIYVSKDYWQWSGQAVFVVTFLGLFIFIGIYYLLLYALLKKRKKKVCSLNFIHLHKKRKWYHIFKR